MPSRPERERQDQAARLLENPLLWELFKRNQEDALTEWTTSGDDDEATREKAYRKFKAAERLGLDIKNELIRIAA